MLGPTTVGGNGKTARDETRPASPTASPKSWGIRRGSIGDADGTSIGGENCRTGLAPQNFFKFALDFSWDAANHCSVWGELLKEKEISPCLTVRADW
jgi:hypothetical protein